MAKIRDTKGEFSVYVTRAENADGSVKVEDDGRGDTRELRDCWHAMDRAKYLAYDSASHWPLTSLCDTLANIVKRGLDPRVRPLAYDQNTERHAVFDDYRPGKWFSRDATTWAEVAAKMNKGPYETRRRLALQLNLLVDFGLPILRYIEGTYDAPPAPRFRLTQRAKDLDAAAQPGERTAAAAPEDDEHHPDYGDQGITAELVGAVKRDIQDGLSLREVVAVNGLSAMDIDALAANKSDEIARLLAHLGGKGGG